MQSIRSYHERGYGNRRQFQQAGYSVAMENGVNEVKQAADFITLSNEADGVAYAIKHFLADRKMK